MKMLKNKKIIVAILSSMALLSLTGCSQNNNSNSNSKTIVIDYQTAIRNHPQMAKAQEEMRAEYAKAQEDNKLTATLTPQEKQSNMMNVQKIMQEKESSIFKPIKDNVDSVINDVMKEKGASVVLDKRVVISGGVDITSDVLIKEGITPESAKKIIEDSNANHM